MSILIISAHTSALSPRTFFISWNGWKHTLLYPFLARVCFFLIHLLGIFFLSYVTLSWSAYYQSVSLIYSLSWPNRFEAMSNLKAKEGRSLIPYSRQKLRWTERKRCTHAYQCVTNNFRKLRKVNAQKVCFKTLRRTTSVPLFWPWKSIS